MGNNPVSNVDPDGGFSGWQGALFGAAVGAILPYAIQEVGKMFDKEFEVTKQLWVLWEQ